MSANTMAEDRTRCLDIGFTGFLSKPCRKELMRSVVKHYIELYEQEKAEAEVVAAASGTAFPKSAVSSFLR